MPTVKAIATAAIVAITAIAPANAQSLGSDAARIIWQQEVDKVTRNEAKCVIFLSINNILDRDNQNEFEHDMHYICTNNPLNMSSEPASVIEAADRTLEQVVIPRFRALYNVPFNQRSYAFLQVARTTALMFNIPLQELETLFALARNPPAPSPSSTALPQVPHYSLSPSPGSR